MNLAAPARCSGQLPTSLDVVAEPVEITGQVSDIGGLELLKCDPAMIRRALD